MPSSSRHTRWPKTLAALALVCAAIMAAPGVALLRSALPPPTPTLAVGTLVTDKSDYQPGQTVRVTGAGFQPGETVQLTLHREPETAPDTVFSAVAGADGMFTDASYVVQPGDYGVTFTLTAAGLTSGITAQTTFTDAPIAFVQTTTGTSTTNSVTATFAAAATANNLIVAIAAARDNGDTITLTAPMGFSTAINSSGAGAGDGTPAQAIFYKIAAGGEMAITVTSSAADTLGLHIYEYSGINTASPLDATGSASGTTATPSSGSVTTTNANDLLIAGLVIRRTAGSYNAPANSFTERNDFLVTGANGNILLAGEERIVNTAGTYSTSAGTSPSTAANWRGLIAAFKQAPNLAPTITKQFGSPTQVTSVTVGGTVPLQFTVGNPNTSPSLSNITFTDTLPGGLVVASPANVTGSCGGGMITATPGSGTISLSGATLAGSASCTFTVDVQGTTSGLKTNSVTATGNDGTATLTSAEAQAMLSVNCPTIMLNSPASPATVGVAYSSNAAASPAAPTGFSYQYSLAGSTTLPPGLMLNATTGAITGTPDTSGVFSFDVKAELFNASNVSTGCSVTETKSITVNCPGAPAITAPAAVCAESAGHAASVPSVPGATNYTWAITNGAISAGQGTNQITWDAGTSGPAEISVSIGVGTNCTVNAGPQSVTLNPQPTADAGEDQTLCQDASNTTTFTLNGMVANGTAAWAVVPGSASATVTNVAINSPNSAMTTVGVTGTGSVTLRLTATSNTTPACGTATSDVTLTVNPRATVDAGGDQTINGCQMAQLNGAVGGSATGGTWTTSGAGTFSPHANALDAAYVPSADDVAAGSVTLTLTTDDPAGPCPAEVDSLDLTITPCVGAKFMPDGISVTLSDPAVCTGPGATVSVTATITNTGTATQGDNPGPEFVAALPAELVPVPGSCSATSGACAFNGASQLVFNGAVAVNQTVTITYQLQVAANVTPPVRACIDSTVNYDSDSSGTNESSSSMRECVDVDCKTAGPGAPFPAAAPPNDQRTGSVLFFNVYTSGGNPARQNTRINLTNTEPQRRALVHLFFVDGATCAAADTFICLTPNQTVSFLASEYDPGVTGYLIAVAVDPLTGCPTNFNYLVGDEYVKFESGHAANLGAVAFAALAGAPPACQPGASSATLRFDGVSYNAAPSLLAVDNLPSPAGGDNTLLILNRFGGDFAGGGAGALGTFTGLAFDDEEHPYSFTFEAPGCQLIRSFSNSFPRTTPQLGKVIPGGQSGWLKFSAADSKAVLGAVIVKAGGASGFNQGHNLHQLAYTATATLTVPVFQPPSCQ
jgi:hypothetical protein